VPRWGERERESEERPFFVKNPFYFYIDGIAYIYIF
jgi:hypothetical protein